MFMIILIVVDFPAPFGPMRPKISPGSVENEISFTAVTESKDFVTCLTSIIVDLVLLISRLEHLLLLWSIQVKVNVMLPEKAKPKTITEYIDGAPKEAQQRLREMRACLLEAAPGAEESIKWGCPAFSYKRILFTFAAFKYHISLYPTPSVLAVSTVISLVGLPDFRVFHATRAQGLEGCRTRN